MTITFEQKGTYDVDTRDTNTDNLQTFIEIVMTEGDLGNINFVRTCLEIQNRKCGYHWDLLLNDLDNYIILKRKNMNEELIKQLLGHSNLTLNSQQVNFGDGVYNDYRESNCTDKMEDKAEEATQYSNLPDELNTEDGLAIMQRLVDSHLMDMDYQPIGMTWSEKGILVDELSSRLHISDKWQVFGTLWHLKPQSLRTAYNKAMDMKKTSVLFDKIRKAIAM